MHIPIITEKFETTIAQIVSEPLNYLEFSEHVDNVVSAETIAMEIRGRQNDGSIPYFPIFLTNSKDNYQYNKYLFDLVNLNKTPEYKEFIINLYKEYSIDKLKSFKENTVDYYGDYGTVYSSLFKNENPIVVLNNIVKCCYVQPNRYLLTKEYALLEMSINIEETSQSDIDTLLHKVLEPCIIKEGAEPLLRYSLIELQSFMKEENYCTFDMDEFNNKYNLNLVAHDNSYDVMKDYICFKTGRFMSQNTDGYLKWLTPNEIYPYRNLEKFPFNYNQYVGK